MPTQPVPTTKPKYQIETNQRRYPVSAEALAALDAHAPAPGQLHLLRDRQGYTVELLALDRATKTVRLKVNGRTHELRVRDEVDQLVDQLGFSTASQVVSKNALAPMPGLVLQILVAEGQPVEAGTPLLILEAMKMENVLKAEGDGTVVAVKVEQGQAVDKKQLLLEID